MKRVLTTLSMCLLLMVPDGLHLRANALPQQPTRAHRVLNLALPQDPTQALPQDPSRARSGA